MLLAVHMSNVAQTEEHRDQLSFFMQRGSCSSQRRTKNIPNLRIQVFHTRSDVSFAVAYVAWLFKSQVYRYDRNTCTMICYSVNLPSNRSENHMFRQFPQ